MARLGLMRTPTAGVTVYAHPTGYFQTWRSAGSEELAPFVELLLVRADEVSLREVRSVVSPDASALVLDVAVTVVDRHGQPIAALGRDDFRVPHWDCGGWGGCFLDTLAPDEWWPDTTAHPVSIARVNGQPTRYDVRFGLRAHPGAFAAGRTVLTALEIRLKADTWLALAIEVPL
jgi:hypothetical protein